MRVQATKDPYDQNFVRSELMDPQKIDAYGFGGHFQSEPRVVSSVFHLFFITCSGREPFGISGMGFYRLSAIHYCHSFQQLRSTEETHSTNTYHSKSSNGLVLSSSTTGTDS